MKFTKASIEELRQRKLPEGKSETIVFDDDLAGFGVRVRAGASALGSLNTGSARNSVG